MSFIDFSTVVALCLLTWSCVEVGGNDAANLVNAVLGSRVLRRKHAVVLAGIAVILGATFSSPVVDTVRKGIFDLGELNAEMAVSAFLASYLVGTVLLYSFSAFGMPVSTTATLVFSLAGASIGVTGSLQVVHWSQLGQVSFAIITSILMSGCASFFAQRIFRNAIKRDAQNHRVVLKHGPWITGLILMAMLWFMLVKGMRFLPFVEDLNTLMVGETSTVWLLLGMFASITIVTFLVLLILGEKGTRYLFHFTAIMGMLCMAFAFGQNDLANCASPGLAIMLIQQQGLHDGLKISVPIWSLSACGVLMFCGMLTRRAQRVTRAEMNTASQQNKVKLYAPAWCCKLADFLIARKNQEEQQKDATPSDLTPTELRNQSGKKLHYDSLRASVILSVGACIIAFASGLGLPISTTYVAFASVIATGWGDRVFERGSSRLKIGRAIWVVTGWFLGAVIAFTVCAGVAFLIYRLSYFGVCLGLGVNLATRHYYSKRGQEHEVMYHKTKKA